MSKNNSFHSLLSVFQDATSSSSHQRVESTPSTKRNGVVGDQHRIVEASGQDRNASSQRTPPHPHHHRPLPTDTSSSSFNSNAHQSLVEPTSTKDPSFSASLLKERIERILRIQQIRKSTTTSTSNNGNNNSSSSSSSVVTKKSFHVAICATIVDEFPHEDLWKKWIEETGGEFIVDDDNNERAATTNSNINVVTDNNKRSEDGGGGKCDGKSAVAEGSTECQSNGIIASAELYIHAKNPERVGSEWLRSKTLPITHKPNWNDVRIVRAMLSLLEASLRDERTTHVLFCTESCIPVATLKEVARSVLLDEVCHWEEEEEETGRRKKKEDGNCSSGRRRRLNWNRSYVDCYGRNSSRCTRFDEHNCWDILRDSIPGDAINKALPGWCFLSRKHAQHILNIPSQLGGLNLWPAFERVWAPEEVYFPTALSLCGNMDDDEVSRRALTHSKWDDRASNQKDRAHPITYDGFFGYELVSRVRRDGCLFLRKMKRPLDVSLWERIVVRHTRGRDGMGTTNPEHELRRGKDREMSGRGRGWHGERHGDQSNDHSERYNRSQGGRNYRPHNGRSGYDSMRGHDSRRRNEDDHQRQRRERGDHSQYDSSRKRQRWRR